MRKKEKVKAESASGYFKRRKTKKTARIIVAVVLFAFALLFLYFMLTADFEIIRFLVDLILVLIAGGFGYFMLRRAREGA